MNEMKECSYCKRQIKQDAVVCIYCGYDHKIGTISQSFKSPEIPVKGAGQRAGRKEQEAQTEKVRGNSGLRKFVFLGLLAAAFFMLYKYNFKIDNITVDIKSRLEIVKDKFSRKPKQKAVEKKDLLNVETFTPKTPVPNKNLRLEGIFFDPQGRSFAAINGQVIPEGESVDNVTVKKINRDSVEIIAEGESKILEVNQDISLPAK